MTIWYDKSIGKNMELSEKNYHSKEARLAYMGYSQFKDFEDCEKQALMRVNGEVEDKKTDSLLFGSYVDAYFSNQLKGFAESHPDMFNSKTGEMKAAFKGIDQVIRSIEEDEYFLKYLSGEHQVIMTGEIAGVPFKIKIDSYHKGKCIVDQKIMKDLNPVWVERINDSGDVKNVRTDFVDAWRYDLEGAIYQEIERQTHLKETGEDRKLPFILAVTTKEDVPDKALIKIDQEYLDKALAEVIEKAPRYQAIKEGKIEPLGCGRCPTCRNQKRTTSVVSYSKFFHKDGYSDIEY